MASTTFIDNQTVIYAAWLNDVNNAVYNGIFSSSSITATNMVCTGTASGAGFTSLINNTFASPAPIGNVTPNTGSFTTTTLGGTPSTVRAINFCNNEVSWVPNSGTLSILNISDSTGSNGANYGLLIRGLASSGATGAVLSSFGVNATTSTFSGSIANASGTLGFPSYATPTSINYDTLTQAPSNGVVTVAAYGPYRNGLTVQVGSTSSLGYTICYIGDDINNNTKAGSFSFPIKAGSWFKVTGWSGYDAFENVYTYFWPVS